MKFANALYRWFQLLYLTSLIVLLIVVRKVAWKTLSFDEVAQRRFAFECLVLGRLAKRELFCEAER